MTQSVHPHAATTAAATVRTAMQQALAQAVAQRAQGQPEAVHQLLAQRQAARDAAAPQGEGAVTPLASDGPAEVARSGVVNGARGPLGALVDALVQRHGAEGGVSPAAASAAEASAVGVRSAATASSQTAPRPRRELATLQRHRDTWSRLSAQQRVHQTLAQVPAQAGPLNSHHLVHRALVLMQEVSPAYLQRFVEHVDALLWLEQQQTPVMPNTTRLESRRKSTGVAARKAAKK